MNLTRPKEVVIDGSLNPEVITHNVKLLALFRLYMLLYKLDVHTLSDYSNKGYAPKLVTTGDPIWRIEVDYRVPLKKIKYYGKD